MAGTGEGRMRVLMRLEAGRRQSRCCTGTAATGTASCAVGGRGCKLLSRTHRQLAGLQNCGSGARRLQLSAFASRGRAIRRLARSAHNLRARGRKNVLLLHLLRDSEDLQLSYLGFQCLKRLPLAEDDIFVLRYSHAGFGDGVLQ